MCRAGPSGSPSASPAAPAFFSGYCRPPRRRVWIRSRRCVTNNRTIRPILVAHRGDAAHHPENTLAAFAGAAHLGLRYVELDVQLTGDGIPLVLHDDTLARTHRLPVRVTSVPLHELARCGVLTGGSRPPAIPSLAEFADWLAKHPAMHVFVELKKESLRASGRERMLAAVGRVLRQIRSRTVLISYDARGLAMAERRGHAIGYVLPSMGRRYRAVAEQLAPRFLFAGRRQILRAGRLWKGPWSWAAFEVGTPEQAAPLIDLGVEFLESKDPARLLAAGLAATRPARQ